MIFLRSSFNSRPTVSIISERINAFLIKNQWTLIANIDLFIRKIHTREDSGTYFSFRITGDWCKCEATIEIEYLHSSILQGELAVRSLIHFDKNSN